MMSRIWRVLAMATVLLVTGVGSYAKAQERSQVKLVLQITVDGLRGDLLNRYGDRFGKGGFRHLLEKGTVFANAHYRHANTETIVGHTTLATGASPADHGMIGNVWFDRETGELAYNIEDPDHPLLPSRKEKVEAFQVDPSQKISRTKGRSSGFQPIRATMSPAATITAPIRTGWRSGTPNGSPSPTPARCGPCSTSRRPIVLTGSDDRPYEIDLKGYGRTFPHPFGEADSKLFNTLIFVSPVGELNGRRLG